MTAPPASSGMRSSATNGEAMRPLNGVVAAVRDGVEASTSSSSLLNGARVVSVSAHDVDPNPGEDDPVPEPLPEPTDIFPAPRVIDARAMDQLVGSLRALVDEARAEAARLASVVTRTTTDETRAEEASRRLQERLALGARMLKAFQAQIDRIESLAATTGSSNGGTSNGSADRLDAASETHLRAFEARLASLTEACEKRLEDTAKASVARCADAAAARIAFVDSAETRLHELHAEALDLVGRAESSMTSLRDALAQAEGAESRDGGIASLPRDLRTLTDAARERHRALGEAIIASEDQVESVQTRMTSLRQRMLESTMLCETRAAELEVRVADAEAVRQDFAKIALAEETVERALKRLAPWTPLLTDSGAQSARERAAKLAQAMREGVATEVRRTATALRSLADEAESMFPSPTPDVAIEVKGHFDLMDEMTPASQEIEAAPTFAVDAQGAD